MGYLESTKGYKIWTLDGKPSKIFISMDITFDEELMLQSKETEINATQLEKT